MTIALLILAFYLGGVLPTAISLRLAEVEARRLDGRKTDSKWIYLCLGLAWPVVTILDYYEIKNS